jgi:hypothetical protein
MPLNELEFHPYLKVGESIPGSRMIIGTFPIYSVTKPWSTVKSNFVLERNDMLFFYGSRANMFWHWYKNFIDNTVNPRNNRSIHASLIRNKISISDVATRCCRIGYSFKDQDLKRKMWNQLLGAIIENRISRIICTSKSDSGAMGWLRDKILLQNGFRLDSTASTALHNSILQPINGSNLSVKKIGIVLTKSAKRVSIVALPSPGSPERRLGNFGYVPSIHSTSIFLNDYLQNVFQWF